MWGPSWHEGRGDIVDLGARSRRCGVGIIWTDVSRFVQRSGACSPSFQSTEGGCRTREKGALKSFAVPVPHVWSKEREEVPWWTVSSQTKKIGITFLGLVIN